MEMVFNWIGGASFILSIGNLKIACDPVLCAQGTVQDYFWFKSTRLEAPVYNENSFKDIDLWLITHNHEDHLDQTGLAKIELQSKVISNGNAFRKLKSRGIVDVTVLRWNKIIVFSLKGYLIEIEAIPAIHGINPLSALFAGRVNGYYLKVSSGNETIRVYITGDAVYKQKTMAALNGQQIDLMIPNMGAAKQGSWIMTLTLNANMLRKMMAILKPSQVIPVHYGTFSHYIEPVEKIKAIHDHRIIILKPGDAINLHYN